MDFTIADVVADAITRQVHLRHRVRGQPRPGGRGVLGIRATPLGLATDPAGVRLTTDVSVVIVEALRVLIEPGDTVIINPPVYPPFFDMIPEAGGRVVEVP